MPTRESKPYTVEKQGRRRAGRELMSSERAENGKEIGWEAWQTGPWSGEGSLKVKHAKS